MLKGTELELPPPFAGLKTVMAAVPVAPNVTRRIWAGDSSAVNKMLSAGRCRSNALTSWTQKFTPPTAKVKTGPCSCGGAGKRALTWGWDYHGVMTLPRQPLP